MTRWKERVSRFAGMKKTCQLMGPSTARQGCCTHLGVDTLERLVTLGLHTGDTVAVGWTLALVLGREVWSWDASFVVVVVQKS